MMTAFFDTLETLSLWLARNAVSTALPALLIALVVWRRWGSAHLRFALAALLLLKLVLPAVPGFSWQVHLPSFWPQAKLASLPAAWPEATSTSIANLPSALPAPATPAPAWWAVLWFLGVLTLAAWWLISHWRVNRWILRQRRSSPIWLTRLLNEEGQSMRVSSIPELCVLQGWPQAAIHGWRHPRLLVPADWLTRLSEKEWRDVLRHELAHVRRHDVLTSAIGFAIASLHWFHPLGWLALRRLRAEAELLCDEAALAGRDPSRRSDYGRILIRLLEPCSPHLPQAVAAFARHRTDIQHRIHMIAQPNLNHRQSRATAWLILPIMSLTLLTAGESENSNPPNQRDSRSTERERDGDRPREGATREGDRPREGTSRDGDRPREGAPRDGDRPREGTTRDGDRPREGTPRDGDRPREGTTRDGDRPREGAPRDGDRPREDAPRESSAAGKPASTPAMVIQLNAAGEVVNSEGRVIPDLEVQQRISQIARSNPGQEILLRGEKDTRYESMMRVLNLLKGIDIKPTLGL